MPIFQIRHITTYAYDRPVRESANQVKIYPFPLPHQIVQERALTITGDPSVQTFSDYWGNTVGWFTVSEPHTRLVIDSQLIVNVLPNVAGRNFLLHSKYSDWDLLRGVLNSDIRHLDLSKPEKIHGTAEIANMVNELRYLRDTPATFVQRCSEFIFENFMYKKGITNVETTVDEILELKSGVCQDFAHVLLEMLRSAGLPARYVSGYICPNRDGLRGAGATHAWVEVFLPASGWVGIDPTNNVWVTDQHVILAVGRHFSDCSPVKGTFKGPANQSLSVFVSVGYEDGFKIEDENKVADEWTTTPIAAPIVESMQQQQ